VVVGAGVGVVVDFTVLKGVEVTVDVVLTGTNEFFVGVYVDVTVLTGAEVVVLVGVVVVTGVGVTGFGGSTTGVVVAVVDSVVDVVVVVTTGSGSVVVVVAVDGVVVAGVAVAVVDFGVAVKVTAFGVGVAYVVEKYTHVITVFFATVVVGVVVGVPTEAQKLRAVAIFWVVFTASPDSFSGYSSKL
jgi:hypothetical protein